MLRMPFGPAPAPAMSPQVMQMMVQAMMQQSQRPPGAGRATRADDVSSDSEEEDFVDVRADLDIKYDP